MNRAFIFNNPKVIKRLSEDFVPVAGNIRELQEYVMFNGKQHDLPNRNSLVSKFFMSVANQTPWRESQADTTQGLYIVGADGTFYGWKNLRGPSEALRYMEQALSDFRARPPKRIELSEAELNEPVGITPDPTTSVIRVFTRIRPLPPGLNANNRGIGRDNMWVYGTETEAIVANAKKAAPGAPVALPATMLVRIVRFHLIDNVRGMPDIWTKADVERASFESVLHAKNDEFVTVSFAGTFRQQGEAGNRSLDGQIEGALKIDLKTKKIVKFRAYSQAVAVGSSTFDKFGAPKGTYPLVVGMIESDDAVAQSVAPFGVTELKDYQYPAIPRVLRINE